MPRTEDKITLTVCDMWEEYAKRFLAQDLVNHTSKRGTSTLPYLKHYYLYKRTWVDTGMTIIDGDQTRKVKEVQLEEVMNYYRFRRIIEHYFNKAKTAIINGESVNIMGRVGKICARRVERDFTSPKQQQIDWKKTIARGWTINPETGRKKYNKVILMTNTDWCRIGWHKPSEIANVLFYQFVPAERNSAQTLGFKLEFSNAIKEDPLLKYQYLYMKRSDRKDWKKLREEKEADKLKKINQAV